MPKKGGIQFTLNIGQMEDVNRVVKTLKASGVLDKGLSIGQVSKSLLLEFIRDMQGNTEEGEGEGGEN